MSNRAIIAAARARANREVEQGIVDLEAAIAVAPEWGRRGRTAVPVKAALVGMLAHLRASYETEHRKAS